MEIKQKTKAKFDFSFIFGILGMISFFLLMAAFLAFLFYPIFSDWKQAHPDMSFKDITQTCFGIFVSLLKYGLWLSIMFSSPFLALKLQESLDYHHPNFNKKWRGILIGSSWLLIIFLSGVAIFWNIQDHPLRAWNSFDQQTESD